MRVTAIDKDGGASEPVEQIIQIGNVPPLVNAGADQTSAHVGQAVDLAATFIDPGTQENHTATINWGDGSPDETGVVTKIGDGGTIACNHAYAQAGVYQVTVTVSDGVGGPVSDTLLVAVDSPVVHFASAIPGTTFRVQRSSNDLVVLRQGTPNVELFRGPLTGIKGLLIYGSPLSDNVFVNLNGLSSTDLPTGIWTVAGEASDHSDNDNLYIIDSEGAFYTEQEYKTTGPESGVVTTDDLAIHFFEFEPLVADINVVSRRFTIGDAGEKMIRIADAGSGMSKVDDMGTVSFESLTFKNPMPDPANPSAPPTFTIEGGQENDRIVIEPLAADWAASFVVQGNDGDDQIDASAANQPVAVSGGAGRNSVVTSLSGTVIVNEGDSYGLAATFPGAETAHIDWGEGVPEPAIVDPSTGKVTGSHVYGSNGDYTVTVYVDDGTQAAATQIVTVANVKPVVNAGADAVIDEAATFSASGFFLDPGSDTWTATVNYGDGSGDESLALNPDKSFALAHVYADNGVYPVTVTVSDDGGPASDVLLVTVRNLSPAVSIGRDPTANEGSPIHLTPSASDPAGAEDPLALVGGHPARRSRPLPIPRVRQRDHVYPGRQRHLRGHADRRRWGRRAHHRHPHDLCPKPAADSHRRRRRDGLPRRQSDSLHRVVHRSRPARHPYDRLDVRRRDASRVGDPDAQSCVRRQRHVHGDAPGYGQRRPCRPKQRGGHC